MAKKPTQADNKGKIIVEASKQNGIDTSVLLNDLIDCFGGPFSLAKAIHQEFVTAKPGSMVRTRTIEIINRLVMANTQYELTNLKKPSDMDDEELEREAARLLAKKETTSASTEEAETAGDTG